MASKKKSTAKPKVADYRVSIIGRGTYKVGGKTLKRGQHYDLAALNLTKDGLSQLEKDPFIVVEAVDEDGDVIVHKPGEFDDEEQAEPIETER